MPSVVKLKSKKRTIRNICLFPFLSGIFCRESYFKMLTLPRKEWNEQRRLGEEYFPAIKNFRWQNNTGGAVKRVGSNTGGPLTDQQQSHTSAFLLCLHPRDYSSQADKHTPRGPGWLPQTTSWALSRIECILSASLANFFSKNELFKPMSLANDRDVLIKWLSERIF